MALSPGTQLGPYRIVSSLGAGGMGEVYRAEDSRLKRTVAIKVLAPDVATPDRIERLEREARAASALNHPNILTIHDVGREGKTAYFAMECVDGQTLRELLRSGPIPLRRTLHIVQQVAEGLAKAHAAGIVHRDLKPENVMVTGDGLVKIVDFGLAKLNAGPAAADLGSEDPTLTGAALTAPGTVLGTVGYMSPEQAIGRPVDYRSDQFAFGLLVYELVTRTRPFDRPTKAQSLAATIEAEPAPIETLNPNVPAHLGVVLTRCLAKEPSDRYESTKDLARDLESILDGLSRVRPSESRANDTTVPASHRVSLKSRPAIVLAAITVFAAVFAVWFWRSRSATTVPQEDRPLIAVRGFRSLSADPQQEYFAAGMTDEIHGQLSQVASLRLLSRNGLDAYKDGDLSRAAREIGLRHTVDGSVRLEGSRVRVSAELVDASTKQTLWSRQYDRDLAGILAVQSDIALQITRALQARLSPSEQQRLEQPLTQNAEAYELYLQARQFPSSDRARNFEGIGLLRKALALDPRFAMAQSAIAYRLMFMGYYDDPSYIDQGIAEAESALKTDPSLAHAYFSLGSGYAMKGIEAKARQAFLRAVELNPNGTGAMDNFSINEINFGRLDDALYWGRRSFTLKGRGAGGFYHLVVPMQSLRADAASRALLEEAERRIPTDFRIQRLLTLQEIFEGKEAQAIARTNGITARFPQNEEARFHRADVAFLVNPGDLEPALEALMPRSASNRLVVAESVRLRYAYVLGKRGDSARAASSLAEAERVARDQIDRGNEMPALRVELAAAAALRKDTTAALDWLVKAHDGGYRDYGWLERDPILEPLRTDARFHDVLDRMRRDVDAQRARARDRGLLDLQALLAPPPAAPLPASSR